MNDKKKERYKKKLLDQIEKEITKNEKVLKKIKLKGWRKHTHKITAITKGISLYLVGIIIAYIVCYNGSKFLGEGEPLKKDKILRNKYEINRINSYGNELKEYGTEKQFKETKLTVYKKWNKNDDGFERKVINYNNLNISLEKLEKCIKNPNKLTEILGNPEVSVQEKVKLTEDELKYIDKDQVVGQYSKKTGEKVLVEESTSHNVLVSIIAVLSYIICCTIISAKAMDNTLIDKIIEISKSIDDLYNPSNVSAAEFLLEEQKNNLSRLR